MPDTTTMTIDESTKNVFAHAVAQEQHKTRLAEERVEAYRSLLAQVFDYCSSDIRAYGGEELYREVCDALGKASESGL